MRYTKYPELKSELKALAKEIRGWKFKRDHWYDYSNVQWEFQYKVIRKAREFRHKHIAYCLLRGRAYFEIECPANDNKPDNRYISQIMEKYEQETELGSVQHQEGCLVTSTH